MRNDNILLLYDFNNKPEFLADKAFSHGLLAVKVQDTSTPS